MKLAPKTINGILHAQNKKACDWGWQKLLAYGCHNFVVVLDPTLVQVVQVLGKHSSNVVKVKWARENYQHDLGSPYNLRLASGDANGVIIIWDVVQGQSRVEFSDGNKAIQDMEWLSSQDASHDLLVVLHQPYSLILWNADTGTKLWKKTYTETLLTFAFDPFDISNVAFLGQDCIVFIDDFSITKIPSSNGKKFYISSPSNQGNLGEVDSALDFQVLLDLFCPFGFRFFHVLCSVNMFRQSQSSFQFIADDVIPPVANRFFRQVNLVDALSQIVSFLTIVKINVHRMFKSLPVELIFNALINVIPLRQRDVLLCLHENGSITTRVRRKTNIVTTPASEGSGAFDDSPPQLSLDVAYDLHCQSDPMRLTRHAKVFVMSCCPVTEKSVALIMSDSRVIFWELMTLDVQGKTQGSRSPLYTPGTSSHSFSYVDNRVHDIPMGVHPPLMSLRDMIGQSQILDQGNDTVQKGHSVVLKFILMGLLNGIASPLTVIRMCPPLTTKNWTHYEPLLASGTSSGSIQILNIASGQVEKEYSLHTSSVRGIEWCGLKSLISFSYPNPGVSGMVKNELQLLNIVAGKSTLIRINRDVESPIELLKVSHLRQYFILAFKDKPFELWDLKTLTILRETGKNLPRPVALEWSPSHSLKTLKRRLFQQHHDTEDGDLVSSGPNSTEDSTITSTSMSVSLSETGNSDLKPQTKATGKEHFVYTDSDGTLYHFVVEGNGFTDATKIPPESGMGTITWIAWKNDNIAFGDVDGQLCLWDLRSKVSRTTSTHRGWIRKIRFAPGRGNFRFMILYNDGIDVWDVIDGKPEQISSLKCPKDLSRIVDVEWAGSDRPVIATADGSVHILNLMLNKFVSPMEEWELRDEIFCPHILPAKGSLLMKMLLQDQLWSPEYKISIDSMSEDEKSLENAINGHLKLLENDVTAYLPMCEFGTAERCLLVSRIFGDESDLHFWTVALHYLRAEKRKDTKGMHQDNLFPSTSTNKVTNDLVLLENNAVFEESQKVYIDNPLERCYDILCDSSSFQKYQLDRVSLHDSKRATYDHTKKCAENYIMLGQTDRAVQLLLETEPDNDSYHIDCLRACLVASIRSSGASQSTIKLVATNLIANGKLSEGVQLLCLIEKSLDACRYLQTYGAWDQAVWLAKATLNYADCCEVMKRWVDYLCGTQVNQKSKAVLVMLSLGHFVKVVEMLYSMRQFSRAACFIQSCREFGVMDKNEENNSLIEAVYLEYARLLINVGHRKAAEFYCQQAGEKGNQLMKEVEILFN
ncbi:hypothetical protein ScPMuIL_001394 [Solemya velum]